MLLQAMMKDQFANYVVQKVLETCDDQNRELILSRIKVHLNALKKYTYGKHIVARVEKLIATGGKRRTTIFTDPQNFVSHLKAKPQQNFLFRREADWNSGILILKRRLQYIIVQMITRLVLPATEVISISINRQSRNLVWPSL